MKRHGSLRRMAAVGAAALALVWGCPVQSQVTDANGFITSNNWLILGPFTNPNACTGNPSSLLGNHIAPAMIHCEFPEAGDAIDYDPALAASTGYSGPRNAAGKPFWRIFNDGTNDCDLNFDADVTGDINDHVSWVVTYVEYLGAGEVDIDLCVNSDDDVQVWVNADLVHNNPACRPRGNCASSACDDRAPVTLGPGIHAIKMAVWERAGGWGGSLRLLQGGVPIVDDGTFPDWVFLGTEGGVDIPCQPLPERLVSSPGDPNACPPVGGGPLSVSIAQGLGASNPSEVIQVVETAIGPFDASKVTAQNGGVVTALFPSGYTDLGFITTWLLLGPYIRPGSDNGAPGNDLMRLDYLTDGAGIDEIDVQPVAGDTVDTDFGGAAASIGLAGNSPNINPGGVPTWGAHVDPDDTINFNDYYGGDINQNMMYALTYVRVDQDIDVSIGLGSDDAIQVYLDDFEIHINNAARWHGGNNVVQDVINIGTLTAGVHRILVKVFEGVGDHGFRLRFQDPLTGVPITSGIHPCLSPTQNPCQFDPIGVRITWNVSRAVLASGVSYRIDINEGNVIFNGRAGGTRILGAQTGSLIVPQQDYGPFTDPNFAHAHGIREPCGGTSITRPSPGTLVIAGAGEDIWATAAGDQFMFAYSEVSGDFSARVTIVDRQFAPGSRWGKHGIMARQNCHPKSRYSFMHDHGQDLQDVTRFASRPSHEGAGNFELAGPLPGGTHYDTLRLDRCGSVFIGYVLDEVGLVGSPGEWVEAGRFDWGPDAPDTVQLGLAVTSHQGCNVTTITFEDWEVLPYCDGPVERLACTENAAGGLDLSWSLRPGGNTAVPISIQVNDVEIASVPGSATSATIPASQLPPEQISKISVVNSSGIAAVCNFPVGYSTQGFINHWLLLGPYRQPGAAFAHAAPGDEAIRRDYLRNADGSINELDVEPKGGDTVMTDYAPGTAASVALADAVGGNPNNINPGGVPTWAEWRDPDDTIDFNHYYGGDVNSIMMYAVTYIEVAQDTILDIGLGSDDSIQLLLDGAEIYINNIARPPGAANEVQNVVPGVVLTQGLRRLMVKVFEGGGLHAFRLRFQDPVTVLPAVPGKIRLSPAGTDTRPRFVRGDADSDGNILLTDAIRVLNFLFTGGPAPLCVKAADADDSGALSITDAVRILNWLFISGAAPAPPSPSTGNYPAGDCGTDPTADTLDCAVTAAKCR